MARTKVRKETAPTVPKPAGTDRFWPIKAVGSDGTIVLDDGRMLLLVAVEPPNVDVMDEDQVAACFNSFMAMNKLLKSEEAIQFLVEGELVGIDEHMEHMRSQIEAVHGFDPMATDVRRSKELTETQFSSWGVFSLLRESVQVAAAGELTMQRRCYIAVPWDPAKSNNNEILSALPGFLNAASKRNARTSARTNAEPRTVAEHRRYSRRARTRLGAFTGTLERQEIHCRVLGGVEALEYFQRRGQPTSTTHGRVVHTPTADMLSDFGRPIDREQAERTAKQLRALLGSAPLNFRRSEHHGYVDQDVVQTTFLDGTPSSLSMFWLRSVIEMRQPFTLSLFLTGLDRLQEQQRLNRRWRQSARENERNAIKGNPDPDSTAQEVEQAELAQRMAMDPMAGTLRTSLYLMVRSPGPDPDVHAVDQEVYEARAHVSRVTQGGTLNAGVRMQEILWQSTLPLGTDYAKRTITMETELAADTVPLIGTGCGSPTGLPLLVSGTGEIEYLAPFDRRHQAHITVVAGTSGTGKTVFANRFIAAMVAMGAQASIIDRAGHYDVLLRLIHGAKKVSIGGDETPWAINHWDVEDVNNVPQAKIRFLVDLHGVMLELDFTREEEALLAKAIRKTYLYCSLNDETPREHHLVSLLGAAAKSEAQNGSTRAAATLETLHGHLQEFIGDGLYGHLWDRETNIPDDAPLLIFDTSSATKAMLIPLMFATMDWIRERARAFSRRFEHHPGIYAGRSVVWLDEGWSWAREPALADYIQTLARQSRHLGLLFGVMSQDAEDFEGDAAAVLRNASIRILLRQDEAMLEYLSASLRLSPEQVTKLGDLRSLKGQFSEALVMNGYRGVGRVTMRMGPGEYWAYTSDPNHDVPLRNRALEESDGNIWTALGTLTKTYGIPTET